MSIKFRLHLYSYSLSEDYIVLTFRSLAKCIKVFNESSHENKIINIRGNNGIPLVEFKRKTKRDINKRMYGDLLFYTDVLKIK